MTETVWSLTARRRSHGTPIGADLDGRVRISVVWPVHGRPALRRSGDQLVEHGRDAYAQRDRADCSAGREPGRCCRDRDEADHCPAQRETVRWVVAVGFAPVGGFLSS